MRIGLGQATTAPLVPAIATSSQLNAQIAPAIPGPTLTPDNIASPLPDITSLAPAAVSCSQWSMLNGLIAEYPWWSVLILSGVFVLMVHKGGKK